MENEITATNRNAIIIAAIDITEVEILIIEAIDITAMVTVITNHVTTITLIDTTIVTDMDIRKFY